MLNCDTEDHEELKEVIAQGCDVACIETPTNPQ